MITFEVHPEIHVRELRERSSFSNCSECPRSFHAKTEDQLSLALCDHCLDNLQNPTRASHQDPGPATVLPPQRSLNRSSRAHDPSIRNTLSFLRARRLRPVGPQPSHFSDTQLVDPLPFSLSGD
jgi:hypothetical protein